MDIENKALFKSECFINGKWIKSINKEVIKVNNLVNKVFIKFGCIQFLLFAQFKPNSACLSIDAPHVGLHLAPHSGLVSSLQA